MKRGRSPMHVRNKSTERSFSMSSLSDCSLGRSPKSISPDLMGDGGRGSIYRDGKYCSDGKYEADYIRKRRQRSSNSKGREKDRYVNVASSSMNKCDDTGFNKSYPIREGKIKPGDRLQRLEQMVELLVSSKPKQSNDGPATLQYEFNPRNTTLPTSIWLNKINDECMDRNFGEKECIEFAKGKMTGLIKAWFKTLDLFDYTWPEIKMLIINTFPDNIDFASTLRFLVNRLKKKEETITQYYFSKMYLIEACGISGTNAVSCLIDGLNDPIWQQDAQTQNFCNPELFYAEFLSKLPNFGLQFVENYVHRPPNPIDMVISMNESEKGPVKINPGSSKYFKPSDDLRNNIGSIRYVKKEGRYSKSSHSDKSMEYKKCFSCKKFGHIAVNCLVRCYVCKEIGHIAAKCPL